MYCLIQNLALLLFKFLQKSTNFAMVIKYFGTGIIIQQWRRVVLFLGGAEN